jgi:hypothetical protein
MVSFTIPQKETKRPGIRVPGGRVSSRIKEQDRRESYGQRQESRAH